MSEVLRTPRLALRELTERDAAFILELLNEPAFLRFIGDRNVRSEADAVKYIDSGPRASYAQHGYGLYRVGLGETDEPLGICGLLKRPWLPEPDIGFALLERHRRRGYTRECAEAVLQRGREGHGLQRVAAITSPDNWASIALLRGLGFRLERRALPPTGGGEVKVFGLDLQAPPAPLRLTESDEQHLRAVLATAAAARGRGHAPFAARLVSGEGHLLLERANEVEVAGDRTAHAEMALLRELRLEADALDGATLYAAAEPCAMCAAAIAWSPIGRLVYGLSAARVRELDGPVPREPGLGGRALLEETVQGPIVVGPALEDEAAALLFPRG